jgi:hypothetical protein
MVWESNRMSVYERTTDNKARFVLGSSGSNPLVCIGLNPNTATPTAPDLTLRIVSNFVASPFDSFLMLNLYPQRSREPEDMHDESDPEVGEYRARNVETIKRVIGGKPLQIYAAWGRNITIRKYLASTLLDVVASKELANCGWWSRRLTGEGHPHHPRGVSRDEPLAAFDIHRYLVSI